MPNNYLSVLYKHIIQVENKNVGLKVCVCVWGGGGGGLGGTNIPLSPPIKKVGGGAHASYGSDIYIYIYIYIYILYIYIYIHIHIHTHTWL